MDRFFGWINRINSILFLLVLIGVGIGTYLAVSEYRQAFARYELPDESTDATDEPAKPAVRLTLGEVDHIYGTDTSMIRLFSEDAGGRTGSGRNERMRNILFLSNDGQHATWLFEKHTNLLTDVDDLRLPDQPTRALYFEAVLTDSDGDGELNEYDLSAVALARPDGSGFTKILDGVDRVLSHEQIDDHHLAVVYEIGAAIWYARFDLDTFAKLSEQSLVDVPQQM